VFQSNIKKT